MTQRISVLIADDHPGTRAGVRGILEDDPSFEVCGEAEDAWSALRLAREHEPDICLLDVHMPGGGIEAAKAVRRQLPRTTVVMLTVSDADEDLLAALQGGAAGYLLKDMDPDRLGAALKGAAHGEAAVPRTLVARLVDELRGRGSRRFSLPGGRTVELSDRERDVATLLCEGLSTTQVAERLFVSPVTVRRHVSALVAKLDVDDRDALLRLLRERSSD